MTRLVFIRHGVTRWNKEKRYCGHRDIGLSDEGRHQAALLSRRLSAVKFDKIYTSSSKRAVETGRIVFKRSRMVAEAALREMNFGRLEGLRHDDILMELGDAYSKWLIDPFKHDISGIEPMNAFRNRIDGAVGRIIRSNPGKTVAVICHGGVIGIFVNSIAGRKNFWGCVPSPASITIVECGEGKALLKNFNETSHLEAGNE